MFQLILYGYIFFLSFTELRLPILFLMIIVPIAFVRIISKQRISISCYKHEDILILLMFIGLLISTLVNTSIKSLNYILAYFFIFGVSYIFLKGVLYNFSDVKKLLNVNTFAVLFVAIFSVIDFVSFSFLNVDVQQIIPRSKEATATYMGGMFRRSYGFASEPTILALYFNTLGILGIWNLWKRTNIIKPSKILLTVIFLLAWISTFSAAGWGSFFISILISAALITLINMKKKKVTLSKKKLKIVALAMLSIIIIIPMYQKEIKNFILPVYKKITLKEVATVRTAHWKWGFENIVESPVFGRGLGSTSEAGRVSTINWYIFLTMEGGLISSIPIILFMLFSYVRIFLSKVEGKFWFMSGFMAGSMHFFAISTFYYPFLWFFLIIFFMCDKRITSRNNDKTGFLQRSPK